VASGEVTGALWAIAFGAFFSLFTYRLRRSSSYVQKTVDDLTQGRQFADPEKARRQTAFGLRLALGWGIGLGPVIAGLGIVSLVVGLSH
jgi:hypothetical protein